jgi:parallel beta-helix repeat protein
MKRGLAIVTIFLVAASIAAGLPETHAKTIAVPNDYPTIQAAINAANNGDTIQVAAGRYYEDVVVNKSVAIIGESAATTLIYCTQESYEPNLNMGHPFDVSADNVLISGMSILQADEYDGAIKASYVKNLQIRNIIFGPGSYAGSISLSIMLESCSNFALTENQVQASGRIEVRNSTDGEISKNTLTHLDYALLLYTSRDIRVEENSILLCQEGIRATDSIGTVLTRNILDSLHGPINAFSLIRSPESVLTENKIINSTGGFLISESGSSKLRGNTVRDPHSLTWRGSSFGVTGYTPEDFTLDIDTSNTIEDKPIYYLQNLHDATVDPSAYPNAGYLAVVSSTRVTVKDFELSGCIQGILFAQTMDSQIRNNMISQSADGIMLACYSEGNLIYGNKFKENENSIRAYYSSGNQIINNDLQKSGEIWIDTSANFTIFGNTLGGFKLVQEENISAYHNNFVHSDYNFGSHYTSDEEYPTGGSYHIDYYGVDLKNGVSQGLPGPDGIGDTAYSPMDYYPLMAPVEVFEAGTWSGKTVYVTLESNSTLSDFKIDKATRQISFSAQGPLWSTGFARAEIPHAIGRDAWNGSYQIVINGKSYQYTTFTGTQSDYAYVSYTHESVSDLWSADSVFPLWVIPLIVVIVCLAAVIFWVKVKRKRA